MNPLLPVVRELAEALIGRGGKLYSKCSITGPRDLEELRTLLERAGMPAAAWLIESLQRDLWDTDEDLEEAETELEQVAEKEGDAGERLEAIDNVLRRGTTMAEKLKSITHIINGRTNRVPLAPQDDLDDDIPF